MNKERYLIESLKEKLSPQFEKIWVHKKPSASKKFNKLVEETFGYLPMIQPEFDMIFKTFDGKLNAIEAKQLSLGKNGYNMAFYQGIGQALALHRFGFDHVGLWLFVNESVNEKHMNKYGAASWHFIRNELKLPLEYTYFKIVDKESLPQFKVMQYINSHCGVALNDIESPNFQIAWKYQSGLSKTSESLKMRALIEDYLSSKD